VNVHYCCLNLLVRLFDSDSLMQITSLLLVRQAFSMYDSEDSNSDRIQMFITFPNSSMISLLVILLNLELIDYEHVLLAI